MWVGIEGACVRGLREGVASRGRGAYAQPPPSRKTIQVLELLALGAK